MTTIVQPEDLYTVLGISPTSTADEIQAAYYRRVRKHPPEKDPEGFKRVQAAYDILSHPVTRKEYDEISDPKARELIDRGRKLLNEYRAGAASLIKRALIRQPRSVIIRDLLTQALMVVEEYDEALAQAHKVLAAEPSNPVYSVRVGDALRALGRDDEALPYYRKAVSLARWSSQLLVKLADLLNALDRPDEAIHLVEEAVHRDGRVDFDDFVYFQCLCTIYALRERNDELAATHRRIRQILPPDPDTRSYVAWFLLEHALQISRTGNYEGAVLSIEEAESIDSSQPELDSTARRLRDERTAFNELKVLRYDGGFELTLRMALLSLGFRGLLGEDETLDQLFDCVTTALIRLLETEGIDLQAQVRSLRGKYRAAGHLLSDYLQEIEELAASTPKRYISLSCPSCGIRSFTERPTAAWLVEDGWSPSQASAVFQRLGETGVLRGTIFTCGQCGTRFNG